MKMIRLALAASILACWSVNSAPAQGTMGGPSSRNGNSALLTDIFGKNKMFSATAHTTIKDASGNETQMEMKYAFLEGKVRTEMDMAKMQGGHIPPEAMAQMKSMGMDRTVSISIPEKRVTCVIYPGLKAYCEMPTPAASSGGENKPPKIERTEVGRENIDGHPCVKYKVVVTPEGGSPVNTLVWQAADLDDYPIQTEVDAGGGAVITTRFQDIDRSKPAASLFEPPSDCKRYGSMQELMMGAMGGIHGGMPHGHPMPPVEKQ